ncbi:MAG: helix-turn-helix transcriptional regulator [Clostridia bacterium]|nr:helix-turn-helix transcriptional regulator [Clostridia bacterium]
MIYNDDGLSFQILMIDRFFHKEGVYWVKPRPYAAFSYRVSGTGIFEIEGKRMVSNPGDILFLPANTPYRVEYSGGESIVAHFRECSYGIAENHSFSHPTFLEHGFRRLLEAWEARHAVNPAKSILYDILDRMARDKQRAMEHTALADCVRYMEAHFDDPGLTVAKLCDVGFVSASGLQRAFAAHFGVSPKQYLTRLRLNRALELLAEGDRSVKEIAFACGFTDEKYFSRAFGKAYGYPPSRFLKRAFL